MVSPNMSKQKLEIVEKDGVGRPIANFLERSFQKVSELVMIARKVVTAFDRDRKAIKINVALFQ